MLHVISSDQQQDHQKQYTSLSESDSRRMESNEYADQSRSTATISAMDPTAQNQSLSPMIPLLSSRLPKCNLLPLNENRIHSDALLLMNIAHISPMDNNSNHDRIAPASDADKVHTTNALEHSNVPSYDTPNHEFRDWWNDPMGDPCHLEGSTSTLSLPFVDTVSSKPSSKKTCTSLLRKHDPKTNHLSKNVFFGSISLFMSADVDSLSPLHIFIRKCGIEAFVATEEDAKNEDFWRLRNFKVIPGRVGIRCIYCRHLPMEQRGSKAVHYPMAISTLYKSMVNWYTVHAFSCSEIPRDIKNELGRIGERMKQCAGGRRRYWTESAIKLGMENTPEGVIFSSYPPMYAQKNDDTSGTHCVVDSKDISGETSTDDDSKVTRLVKQSDKEYVSEYLFLLISNLEPCTYTDEDRTMSRSKIKNDIGFPGLQCMHCHGKSGVGRYFPVSRKAFCFTNSDRNVHNHLTKCRKCPEHIKRLLTELDNTRKPRELPRGARKIFLTRVWNRLHSIYENQMEEHEPVDSDISKSIHSIEEKEVEESQGIDATVADDLSNVFGSHFDTIFESVEQEDRMDYRSEPHTVVPDPYETIFSALCYPV